MAYQQKDNSGSLFKNERKANEKHADYNGTAVIDGTEYWLNAWVNQAKNGKKYLKVMFKPKEQKIKPKVVGGRDFDDPTDDLEF